MIKLIKQTLLLCLVGCITAEVAGTLKAEEKESGAEAKTAPAGLAGKVVGLNKKAGTLTVDIKGKIYIFKMGTNVKVIKDGQVVTPGELAAGQEVNIVTGLGADGNLEIVALTIEPSGKQTEAAGRGGVNTPPPALPPPGNRPPISPNN